MLTRARKMFYRARGYYAGSLGGERFRLDPYHSKFWRKAGAGDWEPETFDVLRAHLDPERDYLDIGAWIGPTVLFGARRARHIWCFEPDAEAYRHLAWNIALNDLRNVSAFAAALAQGVGVARMASFGGEAGDSMTSLLNAHGAGGSDVLTIGWEDFAAAVDLSAVSLVKIDIEGAEFDVLPSLLPWLRAQKPALYLSTHAPFLDPETRAARMKTLAQSLDFYPDWAEDGVRPTGPEHMTSPAGLERFASYLLTA